MLCAMQGVPAVSNLISNTVTVMIILIDMTDHFVLLQTTGIVLVARMTTLGVQSTCRLSSMPTLTPHCQKISS